MKKKRTQALRSAQNINWERKEYLRKRLLQREFTLLQQPKYIFSSLHWVLFYRKRLCLDPYGFYLVILPLGIRWALMKYHIKPLVMTKNIRFSPRPLWVWFVLISVEITWELQRSDMELKAWYTYDVHENFLIFKNPTPCPFTYEIIPPP